jgi:hypothetical protein
MKSWVLHQQLEVRPQASIDAVHVPPGEPILTPVVPPGVAADNTAATTHVLPQSNAVPTVVVEDVVSKKNYNHVMVDDTDNDIDENIIVEDTDTIVQPPAVSAPVVTNDKADGPTVLSDSSSPAIAYDTAPTASNLHRVVDHDFTVPETPLQQVVIDDMEKIKQAWLSRAAEGELDDASFTPYVSKAKRKQLRLAKSTGSHHTRSKGPLPPFSQ